MTIKELLEDLLTEYDELDMQPMILIPDPLDRAKRWKHELEYVIRHLEAEVAREIFEEIEFDIHQLMFVRDETRAIAIEGIIANLKKKYAEGEDTNVPIKKDYYTPEEVRNMSHAEISNNLTVIRESMKRWREK